MRALWIILKTTALSLMAWGLAVMGVGALIGGGAHLLLSQMPASLLTILAGCWAMFLLVVLVRLAWTAPMLTVELVQDYYSKKRRLEWSLIIWPLSK